MNDKEIITNNLLIANFMGVIITHIEPHGKGNFWIAREGGLEPPFPTSVNSKNDLPFNYHKSWDELMPVVEKIEKEYEVSIIGNECEIGESGYHWKTYALIKDAETKIEAVYSAIIEFIKWYN